VERVDLGDLTERWFCCKSMVLHDLPHNGPAPDVQVADAQSAGVLLPGGGVHRAQVQRLHRGGMLLHVGEQLSMLDDELVEQQFQVVRKTL
jgi:hypothetical protein